MKSFPSHPMLQNNRLIAALCEDWLEAGAVTRVTPRADAVCEISRQINQTQEREGQPNKRLPVNK